MPRQLRKPWDEYTNDPVKLSDGTIARLKATKGGLFAEQWIDEKWQPGGSPTEILWDGRAFTGEEIIQLYEAGVWLHLIAGNRFDYFWLKVKDNYQRIDDGFKLMAGWILTSYFLWLVLRYI